MLLGMEADRAIIAYRGPATAEVKGAPVPVYHYSEDPTIEAFAPRPSRLGEALVWAIDEWHSPLYWLPRDCPRVTFWPLPRTTEADLERWWSHVAGRIVVAIEAGWLERVRACRLYRYSFDDPAFEPTYDHGVHLSRVTVRPVSLEPVGDLLARQAAAGVELRLCQSLVPLGKAILTSSLHWSLIRMRKAQGWE
jgi:hypothetical protein